VDVKTFEDRFRATIYGNGSFVIAGEVCFWKNYGNVKSRDRTTKKLLNHLGNLVNWNKFVQAVKKVQGNPSYDNLIALQGACNQSNGFATPITFLAFYKPSEYPMVDKHIAIWRVINRANFGYVNSFDFSQRDDGWIPPKLQNWNAYIDWKKFCNDYIGKIRRRCGWNWRARDVEIAVWEASKNNIPLETL
jgi:hypothetical protein